MIDFLTRHLRLRNRILAGYLLAAIVALTLIGLGNMVFRGTLDELTRYVGFAQQSRLDLLVTARLSEMQRQALMFTTMGYASAADEVMVLRNQLTSEIGRISEQSRPEIRAIAENMSERLTNYDKAFLQVKQQRERQQRLIHADFRSHATEVEHLINLLIQGTGQEPRLQLGVQRILAEVLQVEKHAFRYFDTLDASHVNLANRALINAQGSLADLGQSTKIMDRNRIAEITSKLGIYQKSLTEAVQLTRANLYLINVVMAAEAYEIRYQAKKLAGLVNRDIDRTEQSLLSKLKEAGEVLARVGAGLLLLLLLASYVIWQSITRPIKLLAGTFDKLAKGDPMAKIDKYPLNDELGQLTLAAGAFQHKNQEVLELNESLEQKVLERTAQLETANAAKTQFLAHMSHEIRTPMNAVLGLTQLLAEEPLTPGQSAMVRHISESGQNLLHIINDILDLSKIEAGQIHIDHQPFLLASMLEHIDNLLRQSAENKHLNFLVCRPSRPVDHLRGDPLRIEQVLINLIGNAIKFTEQGEVSLTVTPVRETPELFRLRFEVRDTGIGMSASTQSELFKPFNQGDDSITRRFGGTGLGLSISKRMVELMNGEMGLISAEGKGSTFWFELPLERLGEKELPQPEVAADSISQAAKGPQLNGLRVLGVDDNRLNLMVLEKALKNEGAQVTLASDGLECLQILEAQPHDFDVVLMDIQMPVMDGLTATRTIRQNPRLAHIPVIALTAGVLPEERQAALDAGVNDFMAKPLDLHTMRKLLAHYVPMLP
jgi:signal transduction histidine kinase/CheY-like chemotaxis protein